MKTIEYFRLCDTWCHEGYEEGCSSKDYEFEYQAKEAYQKILYDCQNGRNKDDFRIEIESETSFTAYYDNDNRTTNVTYFKQLIQLEQC